MSEYCVDLSEVPVTEMDWGRIRPMFDAASMNSTSGFNLAYIVYDEPHYSGIHDDNEVIYILEGEGTALIGGQ